MTAHAPHAHDDHHEVAHNPGEHGHDAHHEDAPHHAVAHTEGHHEAPHSAVDHSHDTHAVTAPTAQRVLEAISFGSVKAEKTGPVRSLTGIVKSTVLSFLSPLERLQDVTGAGATSISSVANAKGFKSKSIESLRGIYATGKEIVSYPFKVVSDVYHGIGNSLTHLTNGTTNWLGNTGRGIGNIVKQLYWLPTTIVEKVKKSGGKGDIAEPETAHAH